MVNFTEFSNYVEIYYKLERIAVHTRNYKKHGLTTLLVHMPEHHRKIAEQRGWDPDYYLAKAGRIGPNTRLLFEKIMESKITIHQAYGPCLGILRLVKLYGELRLEAACGRALKGMKYNYGVVKRILENSLDQIEEATIKTSPIPKNPHVRGPEAYKLSLN